eukprot:7389000-Prymnesium_polylepis.2
MEPRPPWHTPVRESASLHPFASPAVVAVVRVRADIIPAASEHVCEVGDDTKQLRGLEHDCLSDCHRETHQSVPEGGGGGGIGARAGACGSSASSIAEFVRRELHHAQNPHHLERSGGPPGIVRIVRCLAVAAFDRERHDEVGGRRRHRIDEQPCLRILAGDDFWVGDEFQPHLDLVNDDGREEIQDEITDEEGVDERLPQPDGLGAVLLNGEADLHGREDDRVDQENDAGNVPAHLEAVVRVDHETLVKRPTARR